jgi:hypothetical protein
MKNIISASFLFSILFSFAQGFDVGFSTSGSPFKLEANYHLNKLFDVGAFYGFGIKKIGFPQYYGASFKYQTSRALNKSNSKNAGYVGVNLGMSHAPSYSIETYDLFTGVSTYEPRPAQMKFCGSAVFATEQFAAKGKLSWFEELHLGYMPSYLGYALKGLFQAVQGNDSDPKKHYWWAFQVGMRIHFGK